MFKMSRTNTSAEIRFNGRYKYLKSGDNAKESITLTLEKFLLNKFLML